MRTSDFLPLIATGILLLAATSCMSPADYYGNESSGFDSVQSGSLPDYSASDFYYHEPGPYDSVYAAGFIAGWSYYRGQGNCPVCHRRPCAGHEGHSSGWSQSSGSRVAHHEADHHSGSTGTTHDGIHHGTPSALKSQRDKAGHGFTGRGIKPAPLSAAEIREVQSHSFHPGRSSGSSSSSSSSGRDRSASNKSKDDDDKKKKD